MPVQGYTPATNGRVTRPSKETCFFEGRKTEVGGLEVLFHFTETDGGAVRRVWVHERHLDWEGDWQMLHWHLVHGTWGSQLIKAQRLDSDGKVAVVVQCQCCGKGWEHLHRVSAGCTLRRPVLIFCVSLPGFVVCVCVCVCVCVWSAELVSVPPFEIVDTLEGFRKTLTAGDAFEFVQAAALAHAFRPRVARSAGCISMQRQQVDWRFLMDHVSVKPAVAAEPTMVVHVLPGLEIHAEFIFSLVARWFTSGAARTLPGPAARGSQIDSIRLRCRRNDRLTPCRRCRARAVACPSGCTPTACVRCSRGPRWRGRGSGQSTCTTPPH